MSDADNPLYEVFMQLHSTSPEDRYLMSRFREREELLTRYAFAIPSPEAISEIVKAAPKIVELGAGTGYWAQQLTLAGADVIAYDSADQSNMHGQSIGVYHPVLEGGPPEMAAHSDRALLLVWPYMNEMAAEALQAWQGQTVIYVGEDDGGCTASAAFFEALYRDFAITRHSIPQWYGIHDDLLIGQRK